MAVSVAASLAGLLALLGAAEPWGGTSQRGAAGGEHVEAARGLPADALYLGVSTDYALSTGLFESADENVRQRQRLWVTWSPMDLLELTLSQSVFSNSNPTFEPRTVQSMGDPALRLKLSVPLLEDLALGAGSSLMVPTSAGGTGLDMQAFVLSLQLLATYRLGSSLQASLNAGYVIDRSDKIFKRELLPVQRFAAGINRANQATVGLGLEHQWQSDGGMALGPFLEATAVLGDGVKFSRNPIVATLGVKVHPFGLGRFEMVLGGDWALQGQPNPDGGRLAGVPPWTVFARLVVGAGNAAAATAVAGEGPGPCSAEAPCPKGECLAGRCVVVKEVVKSETVTQAEPTFRLAGVVQSETDKQPVTNATITIVGDETSALAVNYKDGSWRSWPLAAGGGLLQLAISAPGYHKLEKTMPRGAAGEVTELNVQLKPASEAMTGQIRGSLKDARTGKALSGQVFIPTLGTKMRVKKDGVFQGPVKTGRYQVLISSKGYVTQKKEIEIRAGDVVILNVDLVGRRR